MNHVQKLIQKIPCPTRSGWSVFCIAFLYGITGFKQSNNFLFFVFCLIAGLFVAAFILSIVNVKSLRVHRKLPYPLFAGEAFYSEITVENGGAFLPSSLLLVSDTGVGDGMPEFRFSSSINHVPPGGKTSTRQLIRFSQRGNVYFRKITITSTFPLGLFKSAREYHLRDQAVVYPRLRSIPSALFPEAVRCGSDFPFSVTAAGKEEEFAGLREFWHGDNPKWIHWKSSARRCNQLLVREFEGASARHVLLVLKTLLPGKSRKSRKQFETAVSVAASLARELVRRGYIVDFRISGNTTRDFNLAFNNNSLLQLFHHLALVKPEKGGKSFSEQFESVDVPRLIIHPERLTPGKSPAGVLVWE